MLGSFFRSRYEIRSAPGADAFGSFLRNLLIRDGITGDMLNSVMISGLGMASSTQAGILWAIGVLESGLEVYKAHLHGEGGFGILHLAVVIHQLKRWPFGGGRRARLPK